IGSQTDFSREPKFTEAVARKVYYGPVYITPRGVYMTLALAGIGRDTGVIVFEVSIKVVWDVVSSIKVGDRGRAYLIDAQGRLIAHPDINLVLRNTDMTQLAQVKEALNIHRLGLVGVEPMQSAKDLSGRDVLTAHAPVPGLDWVLFVELPLQ